MHFSNSEITYRYQASQATVDQYYLPYVFTFALFIRLSKGSSPCINYVNQNQIVFYTNFISNLPHLLAKCCTCFHNFPQLSFWLIKAGVKFVSLCKRKLFCDSEKESISAQIKIITDIAATLS